VAAAGECRGVAGQQDDPSNKICRTMTDMRLKEAKDAVEAMARDVRVRN
jgi:hypothetical protein